MNYCINPDCKQRQNLDDIECCQACGTPLLINQRYRLIKPLRPLNSQNYTEIFEVTDGETWKVMKVLKDNKYKLAELLQKEALTLQLLNHPGIPKVDLDGYFTIKIDAISQNLHCLVMEKIEGKNLEEWLNQNGVISQNQALQWLRQILEILEHVHQNGFFHRDIKPSNIICKTDGQLALIDFGSAREITHTYLAKISGGFGDKVGEDITRIISTGYTPLEQINGRAVPQSDFYALGRTFVCLLTGKNPAELPVNSTTGELIWRDKAPQISKPLADFIDDLMAPFPGERPKNAQIALQGMKAFSMWLQSTLRPLRFSRQRLGFTVGTSLGILTIMGILWLSFSLVAPYLLSKYSLKRGEDEQPQSERQKQEERLEREKTANYYLERGLKEQEKEKWNSARAYFEQAIALQPNNAEAHNLLGLACQKLKDFQCAENHYIKSIQLDPNYKTANYNLGGLYDDLGDYERAAAQYKIAMESDSYFAIDALNNLARVKLLQKDSNTAAVLALQGLQKTKDPVSRAALYKNLGWARLQQGRHDEAKVYLQKALDLNNKIAAAHCLLAQVLEAQNDKSNAIAAWKNCLRYESSLPEVKAWQSVAQPHR